MHCPFCSHSETKVNDSRLVAEGHQVRRRRECLACGERFTSFESAELIMPRVIKRDGVREPFNEEKLRSGLMRALEKGQSARKSWKTRWLISKARSAQPESLRLNPET